MFETILMTMVMNKHTDAVLHEALTRYTSKELDDFDVVLFQVH